MSAPALTGLELATGILTEGPPAVRERLPAARNGETPFEALQRACVPALERGRCLVSFSGGRDSSLVLAAAVHAARREGLPLPVPATNRFPQAGQTDETSWQELVVRHLGLDDWLRTDHTDELDVVGPIATGVLRRHGILWPFNSHFHVPLLEAARGCSLLTGIGGDEVFGRPLWARATDVLTLRQAPRPRDAAWVALLASPRAVRRRVFARRFPAAFQWLTPEALGDLARAWGADASSEPARLGRRIEWLRARRWLQVGTASLELLARDAGATVGHPILSPRFAAAVAAAGGRYGFESRSKALGQLFGEVLPAELLARTTKVCFDSAFWTDRSREFADSWDGEGTDPAIVNGERLREEWTGTEPDAHTYLLLQALWLQSHKSAKNGHLDHGGVADGAEAA